MNGVKNKNVLFLCVNFFGYENFISEKIQDLQGNVVFYDERPKNNLLTKSLIRLNKSLVKRQIDKYYQKIWREINSESFDYLFVLKGEVVPFWFIEAFKSKYKDATLYLYLWDSLEVNSNAKSTFDLFNRVFSFDLNDCKEYGMTFRPLFFIDDYTMPSVRIDTNASIDLLFIGTAHTDRYSISKRIKNTLTKRGFSVFCFYYLASPFLYYYKILFEKGFRNVMLSDISFKSLTTQDVVKLVAKSKCVLDIQHSKQSGLTMRTLEVLGSKRKLITTNSNIKMYAFYNPKNCLIINRESPVINTEFLLSEYELQENEIYFPYSLDGWIQSIFSDKKFNFLVDTSQ